MDNKAIRQQFNRQAQRFAAWEPGRNTGFLKEFLDFCDPSPDDTLLDVACGPGEFALFAAGRLHETCGVDISDIEIKIARQRAEEHNIKNAGFIFAEAEHVPCNDNSYSIVVSKSAFHHFTDPDAVFKEMIRCCTRNGKIAIQDIVSFDDNYITDFFEEIDKLVDKSHNRALSVPEVVYLFKKNNIEKLKEFHFEALLSVNEYIGHASQEPDDRSRINDLIKAGLHDNRISEYLSDDNGEIYFKRNGYLILGRKNI